MSNADHGGDAAVVRTPAAPQANPESQGPQQANEIQVDDSNALTSYANFCRVTGTPEELIIDFGLNSQPAGVPSQPIVVTQRIVTNLYTAKRLWQVLQLTIQRHESVFGALETDIQRRVRNS